jgi:hypothetical protein
MKVSTISSLGLGALLLGLAQNPAMGVTIDLFTDSQSVSRTIKPACSSYPCSSVTYSGINESTFTGLDAAIGGQRYMKVDIPFFQPFSYSQRNGSRTAYLDINSLTKPEQATLITDPAITASAMFRWDGGGSLNANLQPNGEDSFKIDILSIDNTVNLVFTVTDTNNRQGTITEQVSSGGEQFLKFANISNPEVDFKDIKSVQLATASEPQSLDFEFAFVETAKEVPFEFSPSLGIILSGSFFGFHVLKKKWKNNSSDKLIS